MWEFRFLPLCFLTPPTLSPLHHLGRQPSPFSRHLSPFCGAEKVRKRHWSLEEEDEIEEGKKGWRERRKRKEEKKEEGMEGEEEEGEKEEEGEDEEES